MKEFDGATTDVDRRADAAPTLVVFSDDWGRHPSSCQHLVRRLLNDHRVVWVNTIGTRPLRLDANTFRRGAEKIVGWAGLGTRHGHRESAVAKVDPSPVVLSPVMWPSYHGRWQRRLNRSLVAGPVNRSLSGRKGPAIAVTTIPLSADMVGALDVDGWVYYCVDDLAAWPGLDASTLRGMEAELVRKADAVVSVSQHLQERLAGMGVRSTLITHGVDFCHWLTGAEDGTRREVLFWGLVDQRLESDWIVSLADRLEDGHVTLAGPVESIDARLSSHPRVKLLGPVPYDDLPHLADRAAVLVMPYRDLAATRAMQPLKLKEYMATGKPCVVRKLPATDKWSDCVDVVDSGESFIAAVCRRMRDGASPEQQEARHRLENESWDAKAEQFRQVLASTLGGLAR